MKYVTNKEYVADAEFDSLNRTRVWCVVLKDLETGERRVYRYDREGELRHCGLLLSRARRIVGHNFLLFDVPHLNRLIPYCNIEQSPENVTDTLIVSRLVYAKRPGGHSIEALGKKHGLKKETIIEYDRPDLIEEYVSRCISDVEINYKIYKEDFRRFVTDDAWKDAIWAEHHMALIGDDITKNGFYFDKDKAEILLESITNELDKLTKEIQESVGPIREVFNEHTLRRKKDGTPDKRTTSLLFDNPSISSTFNHGDIWVEYREREFNPGSVKDRIELLNQSGWKPHVKTKTHLDAERTYKRIGVKKLNPDQRARWDRLKETGWKVCEENLQTLPKDAPTGAQKLAQWLTLEGRRADLVEWLGHYNEHTGRVHSSILGIGSWTHRCAHQNPNCANIFSAFHGEPKSPVDEIKAKYDHELRACWICAPNKVLIGTDAEGIQLRVLAHLMEDQEYIEAVANGNKELKTDVHNVNLRALGLQGLIRDDAKTFIYAWLLGAGTAKVAEILHCSARDARKAVDDFVEAFPGLRRIKKELVPRDAARGFFVGLDGRKVVCDSEHLMLAGYLQNGEKVVMLRANILWRAKLQDLGIPFKQVNFVHDEWQTEVNPEHVKIVSEVQEWSINQAGIDLGLLCPMKGEAQHGYNWNETH